MGTIEEEMIGVFAIGTTTSGKILAKFLNIAKLDLESLILF
jgi:shikimate kinase